MQADVSNTRYFVNHICNSWCCNISGYPDAGGQVQWSWKSAIGGISTDSYWSKNRGRSMEGALEHFTRYGAIAFMLITIALNVLLKVLG